MYRFDRLVIGLRRDTDREAVVNQLWRIGEVARYADAQRNAGKRQSGFWTLNGVPLSPGNHYLIERRDASGISVYQPIGHHAHSGITGRLDPRGSDRRPGLQLRRRGRWPRPVVHDGRRHHVHLAAAPCRSQAAALPGSTAESGIEKQAIASRCRAAGRKPRRWCGVRDTD